MQYLQYMYSSQELVQHHEEPSTEQSSKDLANVGLQWKMPLTRTSLSALPDKIADQELLGNVQQDKLESPAMRPLR